MGRGFEKVVVCSSNYSALLAHACMLNHLGYYSISLRTRITEVIDLLKEGKHFELMIFDSFELSTDASALQIIARFRAITSIILMTDVNSEQRQHLILWARTRRLPLQGILQLPIRLLELKALMEGDPV